MNKEELFAHSVGYGGTRHILREHAETVAEKAGRFAERFGGTDVATKLGLVHDAAKADPRFQQYLKQCERGEPAQKCPHAVPGAVAASYLGPFALAVAGHHAGIPNRSDWKAMAERSDRESVNAATGFLESIAFAPVRPQIPHWCDNELTCEMFLRMVFSCLVDADFLDTERHFSGDHKKTRGDYPSIGEYQDRLNRALATFGDPSTDLSVRRNSILASCREAAQANRGFFDLQVPTGGGKTLSGMAFALDHAELHGMERVIVAIPYTSIIDQTATVYGDVFGSENILEHHSAVDLDHGDEAQRPIEQRRRLAAENWDCPLIVTTTVQLFESLHSNRPSRCRKLHRISNSVIVLDEAQTLPTHLLGPIVDMLVELVEHYGCSVVLSTATLPDFSMIHSQLPKERKALVPDYREHYEALRRVRYVVEPSPWSLETTAEKLLEERQALVVLNTRKDALKVVRSCGQAEGLVHLSTLLCGHHRKRVIGRVGADLREGLPVRLVSTQVIEAGVDLDFPVAMRAMGPLDRIVQVAGRCNREGRLTSGTCIVFELEGGGAPHGSYRTAIKLTQSILSEIPMEEVDSPDTLREFFGRLFSYVETGALDRADDRAEHLRLRKDWAFADLAQKFRMIDEDTDSLLVERYPYENVVAMLENWEYDPRGWFRKVMPFTVSVRRREREKLVMDGLVREHDSGLWIYSGPYDEVLGLAPEMDDPCDLIR